MPLPCTPSLESESDREKTREEEREKRRVEEEETRRTNLSAKPEFGGRVAATLSITGAITDPSTRGQQTHTDQLHKVRLFIVFLSPIRSF